MTLAEIDSTVIILGVPAVLSDVIKAPASLTVPGNVIAGPSPVYSDVQMKAQVALCVTFSDPLMPRRPVGEALSEIVKTTANTIPSFVRLL
jgi:hypothetical protein